MFLNINENKLAKCLSSGEAQKSATVVVIMRVLCVVSGLPASRRVP